MLIILWVYTGCSKLFDLDEFRVQLALQVLPAWSKVPVRYLLPEVEIGVALLLFFRKTEIMGLWLSLILMAFFTIYVGFALFGGFAHVPCSCGGVIKAMGWKLHFLFNLFFLSLVSAGLIIHYRKGGMVKA